jgi:formylglycine-generating enzyme required for sulfatase activity
VEQVSYDMIRGTGAQAGAGWPSCGHAADASSFMGKLQTKTGLTFDLPTEAQWEYACRAGTTTSLNSGKNMMSGDFDDAMDEVGRYWYNGGSGYSQDCTPDNGTAKVGSYLPNAWGLYDMHGNVWEFCLDWYEDNISAYGGALNVNPSNQAQTRSGATGSQRVFRGGSLKEVAGNCRSAKRASTSPSYAAGAHFGFRVICTAGLD